MRYYFEMGTRSRIERARKRGPRLYLGEWWQVLGCTPDQIIEEMGWSKSYVSQLGNWAKYEKPIFYGDLRHLAVFMDMPDHNPQWFERPPPRTAAEFAIYHRDHPEFVACIFAVARSQSPSKTTEKSR